MKKGTVYLITNLNNGWRYVGKTSLEPMKRWQQHLNNAIQKDHDKTLLVQKAIREEGANAFAFEILVEGIASTLLAHMENTLIRDLGTHVTLGAGYNAAPIIDTRLKKENSAMLKAAYARIAGNVEAEARKIGVVRLMWHCKTPRGWRRLPAVIRMEHGQEVVKYGWGLDGGQEVEHLNGHYQVRFYQGGKPRFIDTRKDSAVVSARASLLIEMALKAVKDYEQRDTIVPVTGSMSILSVPRFFLSASTFQLSRLQESSSNG